MAASCHDRLPLSKNKASNTHCENKGWHENKSLLYNWATHSFLCAKTKNLLAYWINISWASSLTFNWQVVLCALTCGAFLLRGLWKVLRTDWLKVTNYLWCGSDLQQKLVLCSVLTGIFLRPLADTGIVPWGCDHLKGAQVYQPIC